MRIVGLVAALLVLSAALVSADDGVFEGAGGAVVLSRSDNVRMVAEEVVFDLSEPEVIHVSCVFVVVNEGPDDLLLVGFPDYWPAPDDDSQLADGQSAIKDLRITVDGLPVETAAVPVNEAPGLIGKAMGPAAPYNQAHVWPCTFARGQTRVLRTEYKHVYSMSTTASHDLSYVLRTGASWKGPIGQVVLRIKRGALRIKCPWYPAGWVLSGDEYVWSASELEPERDVMVGLEDPGAFAGHLVRMWRWNISSPAGDGPQGARKSFREAVEFGEPTHEFLTEVSAALGDSVPEMRSYLEELLATPRI